MSWRVWLCGAWCTALLACSDGKTSSVDSPADGGGEVGAGACRGSRNATPKFPATRDAELLARAATVVGSCQPDDGINRYLADMWHGEVDHTFVWQRYALQAPCLAAAKCGCAAMKQCLGSEITTGGPATCAPCDGTVASVCEAEQNQSYRLDLDCATVGLVCGGAKLCVESSAPTCAAHCAAAGLTCEGTECVGEGAACLGGGAGPNGQLSPEGLACAGAQLDACIGGKHHTIDCAAQGPGFSCQHVGTAFFCGLASACVPGNEPAGVDTETTCEGNTVVICNAGRVNRIDCLSLGFTGCTVDRSKGLYGCVPNR